MYDCTYSFISLTSIDTQTSSVCHYFSQPSQIRDNWKWCSWRACPDEVVQGDPAFGPWASELIFYGKFLFEIQIVFLWVLNSNTLLYLLSLFLLSLFLLSMSDAAPNRPVTLSWLLPVQADTQESGHTASEARMWWTTAKWTTASSETGKN